MKMGQNLNSQSTSVILGKVIVKLVLLGAMPGPPCNYNVGVQGQRRPLSFRGGDESCPTVVQKTINTINYITSIYAQGI